MSRTIIDENEGYGVSVVTFWMGEGEGVQITTSNDYIQMSRKKAIKFLETTLKRLKKDIKAEQWITGDMI